MQSTLSIEDNEVRKREVKLLLAIKDMFPKIVIVKEDIKSFYDNDGI